MLIDARRVAIRPLVCALKLLDEEGQCVRIAGLAQCNQGELTILTAMPILRLTDRVYERRAGLQVVNTAERDGCRPSQPGQVEQLNAQDQVGIEVVDHLFQLFGRWILIGRARLPGPHKLKVLTVVLALHVQVGGGLDTCDKPISPLVLQLQGFPGRHLVLGVGGLQHS